MSTTKRRRKPGSLLTKNEVDTALMLIADGRTMRQIAATIDCHPATINRILLEMPEDYEQAKEQRRDRIRQERWERAFDRDDRASAKFLDDIAVEQLPETRESRRPSDTVTSGEDRSAHIAAAIDRFTSLVVSLAAAGRAGVPGGEPDGRGESAPGLPVGGVDSTP